MAINAPDAEKDKLLRDNQRLRDIIPNVVESLMIGEKRPDSPTREPGGPPWPGYPNPMPPGKDWPPVKLAHGEGRGPQTKFHDEYNRPLNIPPWLHADPSGNEMEIPWQKEQYMKEHPQFFPELKISDHRGLTNYLDSKGRSGKTGSFKDSGLTDKELKEALMIGIQLMKV